MEQAQTKICNTTSDLNEYRTVRHLFAVMAICLFSFYYFVLESQTYDIAAYKNISFFIEPELFQAYQLPKDKSGLSSFHANIAIRLRADNEFLEYEYVPVFEKTIRTINRITGNTIISAKILVFPKLLIYLMGMYTFLFYFTYNTASSLLLSLLSIVPRFLLMQDNWGIGPLYSTQPKDFLYAIIPLVFLVFIHYRKNIKVQLLLYLGVGLMGNIHPGAALNFIILFILTQLFIQESKKNKLIFTVLPCVCAILVILPFLQIYLYKMIVLKKDLVNSDLLTIGYAFNRFASPGFVMRFLFSFVRPVFSLNTLTLLLPVGYWYYRKNFNNNEIHKIIMIHIILLLIICIPGLFYSIAEVNPGGYIGYIGRSNIFLYLYIYLFIAYLVKVIFEKIDVYCANPENILGKAKPFLVKSFVSVVTILIVYPPISIKPNNYWPKYDFKGQINSCKTFFKKGFVTGAISEDFTEMAAIASNLIKSDKGHKFITYHYAEFIILTSLPTYEVPSKIAALNNKLSLYEKIAPSSLLGRLAEKITLGNFDYEDTCQLYLDNIKRYSNENMISHIGLHKRYKPLLSSQLVPVWQNSSYMICRNNYLEQ